MEIKTAFKVFHYDTQLEWTHEREGELSSGDKPPLAVAPPPEFKGPGGLWTPEDMFVAAVDACTMTTFLAFAVKKQLSLVSYESSARGTLENVGGKFQFTQIEISPTVTVANPADVSRAEATLQDAEAHCLISNSIKATVHLKPTILVLQPESVEGN
ncbi:MAG: OsmC family protein [Acidobacteriia bacterium]|nr:OsmC family protein [Terriglobia bacterium]